MKREIIRYVSEVLGFVHSLCLSLSISLSLPPFSILHNVSDKVSTVDKKM